MTGYKWRFNPAHTHVNVVNNILYEDDLTEWFWVYFGYSETNKKLKGYIKFQDREAEFTADNHLQYVPSYMSVHFGRDPFYHGFNGQMKGWNFEGGRGAFRDGEYEELYNQEIFSEEE